MLWFDPKVILVYNNAAVAREMRGELDMAKDDVSTTHIRSLDRDICTQRAVTSVGNSLQ